MNLKDKDMTPLEEMLTTEIIMANERINDLEYVLGQLKSQLLDVHAEDSLIINIITQALKK